MFCFKCGKSISEEFEFCPECGAKQIYVTGKKEEKPQETTPADNQPIAQSDVVQQQFSPIPSEPETPQPQKAMNKKLVFGVLGGIVAVVAIVAVVFYLISPAAKANRMVKVADKFLEELNYEDALNNYLLAIEIDPKCEKAYTGASSAYEGMGDYENAVEIMNQGLVAISRPRYIPNRMNELTDRINTYFFSGMGNTSLIGSVSAADEDTDFSNNMYLPYAEVSISLAYLDTPGMYMTCDEFGEYRFSNLITAEYKVTASAEGYIPDSVKTMVYEEASENYASMFELVPDEYGGYGDANGTIWDAVTGDGVGELQIDFIKGSDNTRGDVIDSVITNYDGSYYVYDLEAGNYTAMITDISQRGEDERYIDTYINVKVLGNRGISNQDGAVTNQILDGQLRVVLTWGEYPYDLDSHLAALNVNNVNTSTSEYWYEESDYYGYSQYPEVYYGYPQLYSNNNETIAFLDWDDTESYGPETVTVYTNMGGIYGYYVYDYTNQNTSNELSSSGAAVKVYKGNMNVPSASFSVPRGSGGVWTVFTYDSANDVLTPINRLGSNPMF